MRLTFTLIALVFLFARCHKSPDVAVGYPTTMTDTLGIRWTTLEGTNITYCFQDSTDKGSMGSYVAQHEDAFAKIAPIFGPQLPCKLRFYIWADATLATQKLGRSLGFADPVRCIVHVRPTQTLGHEMTHVLSYWARGIVPTSLTQFINEGVAVAFDLNNPTTKMSQGKSMAAGQNIHSVADVWSGRKQLSSDILYPLAGAFAQYMYNSSTADQFFALIKNQTINGADSIYGKEKTDSLIADFNKKMEF